MAGLAGNIRLFHRNTDPSITDVIEVDGAAVNLTGATVRFRMRKADASATTIDAAAAIDSPTGGAVRYDWQTNDLAVVANYQAWWHITFSGGATQDTPEFGIKVLPHGATTGDLCTVFDVREAMGLPTIATQGDDQLQEYITEATDVIIDMCKREFTDKGTLTRRFKVMNGRVDFYPYDLRTLTTVVLSPENGGGITLNLTQDVEMSPFDKRMGVWTSMKISPFLVTTTPISIRFGNTYCDVTGAWGMATIPPRVKRAAVITVRSWMRADAASFGNAMGTDPREVAPRPQATYDVPFAAQKLLKRTMRWPGIL